MKILLTGNHGYIGSVSVRPRAAGHEVTGLDTFFYEGCDLGDDRSGHRRSAARRP